MLVVENDRATSDLMSAALESHTYAVLRAPTAATARNELQRHLPDLVVLDLKLPDADGYTLLSEIRRARADVPVIVCCGLLDAHRGVLQSLALGADDFISQPFDALEFEARVEAVLRRSRAATPASPAQGDGPAGAVLRIDHAHKQVIRGQQALALSSTQYSILAALAHRPGDIVSHHELARVVWGPQSGRKDKALSSHVRALRAKLGASATVSAVPGFGYRLDQT